MTVVKNTGLILGFVPLIVFGLLSESTPGSMILAIGAAAAVSVLVGFADLRKRRILAWTNIIFFSAALIAIGVLGMDMLIPYMGILIYATLSGVTLFSIAAKKPFTIQYAREMVAETLWKNPAFIRINLLMTGAWGAVFIVNLALSSAAVIIPGTIGTIAPTLTYAVLAAGIIFTLWYPGYIRRHAGFTG